VASKLRFFCFSDAGSRILRACGVGVWSRRDGACCVAATRFARAIASLAIAAGVILGPARVCTAQGEPPERIAGDLIDTRPPGPKVSLEVFRYVRDRVLGGVGRGEGLQPPAVTTGGVEITLRLDGVVLARVRSVAPLAGHTEWLSEMMDSALERVRAAVPRPRDAVDEQAYGEKFARIMVSLELAGPLIPVLPATFAEVDAEYQPGLDGVGARFGETLDIVFPAWMLMNNTSPAEALASAISQASGDPTLAIPHAEKGQPGAIAASHGATYYRFRVTHLAQPEPESNPRFMFRGGRVVDAREIDGRAMRDWAQGLAGNLLARVREAPVGAAMAGTFWPAHARYDPAEAGPVEQSAAAIALARFSRAAWADPALAKECREVAQSLCSGLAVPGQSGEGVWDDPVMASVWVCAVGEVYGATAPAELKDALQRCSATIRDSFREVEGFSPAIPAPARGMVAWALVHLSRADMGVTPETARAAVGGVFRQTTPSVLVSQMPWLGWAVMDLAGDGEVASAAALRAMRAVVWEHQIDLKDASDDMADLTGGIVFTASRAKHATWQGARPLAFMAGMLGDRRMTDDRELLTEVGRLMKSVRFLRQLTVDTDSAYSAMDRPQAMFGVRSSVWDQRQPVEATALTLLMATETLGSLEAIENRGREKPKKP
jgi:hypothetical protein